MRSRLMKAVIHCLRAVQAVEQVTMDILRSRAGWRDPKSYAPATLEVRVMRLSYILWMVSLKAILQPAFLDTD